MTGSGVLSLARRVTVLPAARGLRASREAERAPHPLTLAELELAYLAWLEQRGVANTLRTYRDALQRWGAFLFIEGIDIEVETTEALSLDAVDKFIAWLRQYHSNYRLTTRGKPLSDLTVQTYANAVLGMFKYGCRRRLVDPRFVYADLSANAYETLGRPMPRPLKVDRRIASLVEAADSRELPAESAAWSEHKRMTTLRDRAVLRLLLVSGLRRAEVVSLNRADVDDGHASEGLVIGKGRKMRPIFFDEPTQAAIRAYLEARADDYRPLFLRHDNRRGAPGPDGERWRMGYQAVWLVVKHYAAEVGIHATPHQLRHAMATGMLNRGADLSVIQDLLGHASPNVTKAVYAHYDRAALRRAFKEFSPLEAGGDAEH